MSSVYDAFEDSSLEYRAPDKQFFEFDLSDDSADQDLHKWLIQEKSFLEAENRDRFEKIKKNLARLKGIQYQQQDVRADKRTDTIDRSRIADKITVNLMRDLMKIKVARLIKYRPGIQILPQTDDFEDKLGAEVTKDWLDNIWYERKFDGLFHLQCVRAAKSMGECYLGILWDKDLGPEHPEWIEKYKDKVSNGQKMPLLDEYGAPSKDKDGKPVMIDSEIRVGDVGYSLWYTLDVLPQKKKQWKEVEYIFRREVIAKALVKRRYPKASPEVFDGAQEAIVYDYEKMDNRKVKNEIVIWHMWHKKTGQVGEGAYICFTEKGIIKKGGLPFEDGELPVERLIDETNDGELHGQSFLDNIRGLCGVYNNLTNIFNRNILMVGHPKWAVPAGSVKREALGNDITIMEFKGPMAPQLTTPQVIGQDQFQFRNDLKEEIIQQSGLSGMSRAEPPAGVKAFVAMQFLYELDQERMNEDVLVHNEWIKNVAIKTIARAAQNYEDDDGRQMLILGDTNAWMTKELNVSYLKREYEVRCQNASALPESKSARMETLLELDEKKPGLVPDQQFVDLFGLAQDEKYRSVVTRSVRAAEAENQLILKNEDLNDPEKYEDHIQHWNIHVGQLREWNFKNKTPKDSQMRLQDHVMAHEMLMVQKAKQNPAFMQMLMGMPDFPIFYKAETSPDIQAQEAPPPLPGPDVMGEEMAGAQLSPELDVKAEMAGAPPPPPSLDAQAAEAQMATAQPIPPTAGV